MPMPTMAEIQALADEIAEKFQPKRIILFGSYAYGVPTSDSDVDLLIVLSGDYHHAKKATEVRLAVHKGFPMDILVRTPDEIEVRLAMGDSFMKEIISKGKELYAARRIRVG